MTLSSSSSDSTPGPSDGTPGGAGFIGRMILLLSGPGRLGDCLRERPVWWDVLLLGGLMVGGANMMIPPEVWEDFMRAQAMAVGSGAGDGAPSGSGEMFRILSSLAAPVAWGLFMLISAGIMTFVFAFLLGDQGRFAQYFSGTAHAALLTGIGSLVVAPLRAARSDPQLTLSVGTFLQGALDGSYVGVLLNALDLFGIWAWVVMGILFSRFDAERSAGSAVAIVVGISGGVAALVAFFQYRA